MDGGLELRIRNGAVGAAQRVAPWRSDIAWWIVGLQGVVAIALGLLLLFNQGAGVPLLWLVGLLLLLLATVQAWSAMRLDLPQVVLGWRGLRAGVGLMTGALVMLGMVTDSASVPVVLAVLALGLVLAGLLGVAEWWLGRAEMRWRWPTLVGPLASIAFGATMLLSRLQAAPLFLQAIAGVSLVLGVLLVVRAALLLREDRLLRSRGVQPTVSSASTPIPQSGAGSSAPAVTLRSAGSGRHDGGGASTARD